MDAARLEPLPALALTVSARNPTAISLSRRVGFTEAGNADGILVMALLLDEEGSTAYQLGVPCSAVPAVTVVWRWSEADTPFSSEATVTPRSMLLVPQSRSGPVVEFVRMRLWT